jgi:hypothetical protein
MMNQRDIDWQKLVYQGLKSLIASAFPKKCNNCGRTFEDEEAFVIQTETIRNISGLKESIEDDGTPIVELFRNCVCGSTLMDEFQDRRDLSERGLQRRKQFGKLLVLLENAGMKASDARQELLVVMLGGNSEKLAEYGIKFKDH